MTGGLRRRWRRLRHAVGYWWLEQTDGIRTRRPRRHARLSARVGGAATAIGDWWSGLGHEVTSRTRRLAHATRRRLPHAGSSRPPRQSPPRPTWRRRRWSGALTTAGDRIAGLGLATTGGARAIGTTLTGGLTALGADTDDTLTALGHAAGRSGLTARRGAVAAVTGMVVAGVVLGATRLPGGDPSDERGGVTSRLADSGASQHRGRSHGPGFTRPGIHLSVSPQGSGDLEVVERVMVSEPISMLPLSAPPSRPDADAARARLVDLRVSADGRALAIAGPTEVDAERELSLPRPATTIELRYRVEDADQRSEAAPAGRATLSLRPAAAGALSSRPTVVQVRGAVVHTLVCVDEPRARQLCGVDTADGWRTEPVTAARSSVVALVDLPPT